MLIARSYATSRLGTRRSTLDTTESTSNDSNQPPTQRPSDSNQHSSDSNQCSIATVIGRSEQPEGPNVKASSKSSSTSPQVKHLKTDDFLTNIVESSKLCSTDFICPICCDLLKEPFITPCGHSYCYACIKDCKTCPICHECLNQLILNRNLSKVVEKFKKQHVQLNQNIPVEAKKLIDQLQSINYVEVQTLPLGCLSQSIQERNKEKKLSIWKFNIPFYPAY